MNQSSNHHFFLGIFVLAGFGLIATAVTLLGAKTLWEDYEIMETYIEESVSGLEVGSPVKFRGITVGKVTLITTVARVYETKESYALVRVRVQTKALSIPLGETASDTLTDRVRNGLRVTLASSGITGGSYLETEYRSAKHKDTELKFDWEPAEIYVPSFPSTLLRLGNSLDTVLDNLAKTDIQGVVAAARDTLREFETSMADVDFKGLSTNAQDLMSNAATTVKTAGTDFDALSKEITKTMAAMRKTFDTTFATADQTLAKVNDAIDRGKLVESMAKLSTLLTDAERAVEDIRLLTKRADHTVASIGQIVRGRSREVQIAICNLREILENINSLTGTLTEYPSLLFVGNAPKGASSRPPAQAKAGK